MLNALNLDACTALLACCEKLARRRDCAWWSLRGEGSSFMAGGDLGQFRDSTDRPAFTRQILEPLNAALLILDELPLPVIAAVQGAAAGAGASIALAADLVIAAEDAKFIMAYARVGTSLDGGSTWALPRLIGLRRAMEMALLAEPVGAAAGAGHGADQSRGTAGRVAQRDDGAGPPPCRGSDGGLWQDQAPSAGFRLPRSMRCS